MTNHLLPNLSEILPNRRIEMAQHIDQMMENNDSLALGPEESISSRKRDHQTRCTNICVDICDDKGRRGEAPIARRRRKADREDSSDHRWPPPVGVGQCRLVSGKRIGTLNIFKRILIGMLVFELFELVLAFYLVNHGERKSRHSAGHSK